MNLTICSVVSGIRAWAYRHSGPWWLYSLHTGVMTDFAFLVYTVREPRLGPVLSMNGSFRTNLSRSTLQIGWKFFHVNDQSLKNMCCRQWDLVRFTGRAILIRQSMDSVSRIWNFKVSRPVTWWLSNMNSCDSSPSILPKWHALWCCSWFHF